MYFDLYSAFSIHVMAYQERWPLVSAVPFSVRTGTEYNPGRLQALGQNQNHTEGVNIPKERFPGATTPESPMEL